MIKFDEFYYGSFDESQEQRGVIDISYNLTAGQQKGGTPTINVLISGVSPLALLNAKSLNYVKAFGKCEQDLTPTPASPVDIIANNGAIKAFCGNKWTDVNKLSGYIIQNQSGVIQANNNYNVSAPILLKAGDYSVSYYTSATGSRPFTIWESNAQGDLIGERGIFNILRPDVGTNTGSFTIDRDMYVRISWRNDFTDIVVAPTTAIIYIDGTVETVSIDTTGSSATCQHLLSVDTYKDEQNITSGAITRNVRIQILDGTEDWEKPASAYFRLDGLFEDAIPYASDNPAIICSHFVGRQPKTSASNMNDKEIKLGYTSMYNRLYLKYYDMTTADDLKQWLASQYAAGTPVIIVYPLATPTTETITGQTLTITQGTNVVTATGAVSDLELEISYKAYAEITVEEIEAINIDDNVLITIN